MIFFLQVELSGEEEDLNSVLTRISRQVALDRQSNVPSDRTLHHKRQIPLKQDTLIRYDLYNVNILFDGKLKRTTICTFTHTFMFC